MTPYQLTRWVDGELELVGILGQVQPYWPTITQVNPLGDEPAFDPLARRAVAVQAKERGR